MLISKMVMVRWSSATKKWFENKGYTGFKNLEYFEAKVEDLMPRSEVIVKVKCDYCFEDIEKTYKDYKMSKENTKINKDACEKCKILKTREVNLLLYGAETTVNLPQILEKRFETNEKKYGSKSPYSNEDVREKAKQTIIEKYGVDHYAKTDEYKEKTKTTNLERYGVENPFQYEEFKQKSKETNLSNYGTEYPIQSEEFQNKMKIEMLNKYGVEYNVQRKEVIEKSRRTMYENRTVPTSRHQIYLWNLLGGELNFPFKRMSIDIAFPNEKIGIEYDGGGHWLSILHGEVTEEEFIHKERKRNYSLKRGGWKIIRIVSKSNRLPHEEIILKMIEISNTYFDSGRSWIEFDIDKGTIRTNKFEDVFEYGKLRSYYSICKLVNEYKEVFV